MEKKAADNNEGRDRSFENLLSMLSNHGEQLTTCAGDTIDQLIQYYKQNNEGRAAAGAAAAAEEYAVCAAKTKLLPSLQSLSDKLMLKDSDAVQNIRNFPSRGKFGETRKLLSSIQEIIAKLPDVGQANEAATAEGNIDAGETADNAATAEGNIDAGETADNNVTTYGAIQVIVRDSDGMKNNSEVENKKVLEAILLAKAIELELQTTIDIAEMTQQHLATQVPVADDSSTSALPFKDNADLETENSNNNTSSDGDMLIAYTQADVVSQDSSDGRRESNSSPENFSKVSSMTATSTASRPIEVKGGGSCLASQINGCFEIFSVGYAGLRSSFERFCQSSLGSSAKRDLSNDANEDPPQIFDTIAAATTTTSKDENESDKQEEELRESDLSLDIVVYPADSESKQLMGSSDEGRVQNESAETSNSRLDTSLLRRLGVYLNNCNRPPGSMGQKKTGRKLLEGSVLTNTDESVEKLYSGQYSDVFVERKDGKQYVVKRIQKKNLPSRHLYKEVYALSCLGRHPNIIHFIDEWSDHRYLYIFLEFIPGGTLNDFVKRRVANKRPNKLPLHLWTFLMKQLADGLKYIHKQGVAHRDIKPDNLLMKGQLPEHLLCESRPNSFASNGGGSFQLKIADFGFSTVKEQSRTLCGSPVFMPPEMMDEMKDNDRCYYDCKAVDVWSTGVVGYNLLFGDDWYKNLKTDQNQGLWRVLLSTIEEKGDKLIDALATSLVEEPNKRESETFFRAIEDMQYSKREPPEAEAGDKPIMDANESESIPVALSPGQQSASSIPALDNSYSYSQSNSEMPEIDNDNLGGDEINTTIQVRVIVALEHLMTIIKEICVSKRASDEKAYFEAHSNEGGSGESVSDSVADDSTTTDAVRSGAGSLSGNSVRGSSNSSSTGDDGEETISVTVNIYVCLNHKQLAKDAAVEKEEVDDGEMNVEERKDANDSMEMRENVENTTLEKEGGDMMEVEQLDDTNNHGKQKPKEEGNSSEKERAIDVQKEAGEEDEEASTTLSDESNQQLRVTTRWNMVSAGEPRIEPILAHFKIFDHSQYDLQHIMTMILMLYMLMTFMERLLRSRSNREIHRARDSTSTVNSGDNTIGTAGLQTNETKGNCLADGEPQSKTTSSGQPRATSSSTSAPSAPKATNTHKKNRVNGSQQATGELAHTSTTISNDEGVTGPSSNPQSMSSSSKGQHHSTEERECIQISNQTSHHPIIAAAEPSARTNGGESMVHEQSDEFTKGSDTSDHSTSTDSLKRVREADDDQSIEGGKRRRATPTNLPMVSSSKSSDTSAGASPTMSSPNNSSQDPSPAPIEEQECGHDTKRERATGLINLGNSCFMNSILQCLAHTAPLREYFLSGEFEAELNKDNKLGTGGELALEFARLLRQMWSDSGSGLDSVTNPRRFKQVLDKFAEQFRGVDQHDSQELCTYLLDILHEDTNRVKEKPPDADKPEQEEDESDEVFANRVRNYDLQWNDSRVYELFEGQLKSQLKCCASDCERISTTFDSTIYFSLPLPEVRSDDATLSLMDCITKFGETEQFGENDKWPCDRCNERVRAFKTIQLYRAPPILFIHLKRFHFSPITFQWWKVKTLVDFPLNGLDLRDIGTHWEDGEKPIYDLYAVSNHYGQIGNGHYTAFAKGDDGTWCEFNDHKVTNGIDESKIVSKAAYCLFYKRKDVTFNCVNGADLATNKLAHESTFMFSDDKVDTGGRSFAPPASKTSDADADADAESPDTPSLLIADAARGNLQDGEPHQSTTPHIGIETAKQQKSPTPQTTTANTKSSTKSFVSSLTVTSPVEYPMSGAGELSTSESRHLQPSPRDTSFSPRTPSSPEDKKKFFVGDIEVSNNYSVFDEDQFDDDQYNNDQSDDDSSTTYGFRNVLDSATDSSSASTAKTKKRVRAEDDKQIDEVKKKCVRAEDDEQIDKLKKSRPRYFYQSWDEHDMLILKNVTRSALHGCLNGSDQQPPRNFKVVEIEMRKDEFLKFIGSLPSLVKGKNLQASSVPVPAEGVGWYLIMPGSSHYNKRLSSRIKWAANHNPPQAKYKRVQDFEGCKLYRISLRSLPKGDKFYLATVWVVGMLVLMEVEEITSRSHVEEEEEHEKDDDDDEEEHEKDDDDDDDDEEEEEEEEINLNFEDAGPLLIEKSPAPTNDEVVKKLVHCSRFGAKPVNYVTKANLEKQLKSESGEFDFCYRVYLLQLATLLLGLEEKVKQEVLDRLVRDFTSSSKSSQSESDGDSVSRAGGA